MHFSIYQKVAFKEFLKQIGMVKCFLTFIWLPNRHHDGPKIGHYKAHICEVNYSNMYGTSLETLKPYASPHQLGLNVLTSKESWKLRSIWKGFCSCFSQFSTIAYFQILNLSY